MFSFYPRQIKDFLGQKLPKTIIVEKKLKVNRRGKKLTGKREKIFVVFSKANCFFKFEKNKFDKYIKMIL